MQLIHRIALLSALILLVGCVSGRSMMETPTPKPEDPVPEKSKSALESATAVFIGTPHHSAGALIAARARFVSEPPPPPEDDRTVFHDRHNVTFEVVEVIKNPYAGPSETILAEESFDVSVAIAVVDNGSRMDGRGPVYDKALCATLDEALTKPFVIVFGRSIYVDRGNASVMPRTEAWTVGTDPTQPNRGFDTLEAAKKHAATLHSSP